MKSIVCILMIVLLSSCSLAPTYHPPRVDIPANYKETGIWLRASPNKAANEKGPWWNIYKDPELNRLEDQLCDANQNLRAAIARYEAARAIAAIARAGFFPTVIAVGNASRQQTSASVANRGVTPYSDFLLSADLSYEVDVWGRVRNNFAAATSQAKASAADVASIHLSLQADLASDYFALRAADVGQKILDDTVIAYGKALKLTQYRFQGGASPVADVDQAEAQYENAKTAAADNHIKRDQFEHAIAVLVGEAPANFSIAVSKKKLTYAWVVPDLPSTLLERRPDIAAAELRVEAANYQIGVARAAFFPSINLSTGLGFESSTLANLISAPSLIWSLGPSSALGLTAVRAPLVSYTVFDGGKINAMTYQAWANYHENVANYKQTVLNAFQEVEDNLVSVRELEKEFKSQNAATRAANRALGQSLDRYRGGVITFLDVVVIQNIALQAELEMVDVILRRQVASVRLIQALGGEPN